MSLMESIPIALFCIAIVFAVLGMLWAILRLFSAAVQILERRKRSADLDR